MFATDSICKRYSYLTIGILLIFSACADKRFKGYSLTHSGLYYKIVKPGEGQVKPKAGEYLQIKIVYKTIDDSIFLDTYSYNESGKVILPYNNESSFKGSFEEMLSTMNEGDTYSFIVNTDSLFVKFFKSPLPKFLQSEDYVKMDVFIDKILDYTQYVEELNKHQALAKNRQATEREKLKLYIDTSNFNYFRLDTSMYYLPIKQGIGNRVRYGDEITIHYTGCFLNGKVFESSYNCNQPLQFILGQESQIIKGIENGISLMNEGAKTKFIIPSHLAFGSAGSSTGIVPPYTTVIYEVELVNVIPQQLIKNELIQ